VFLVAHDEFKKIKISKDKVILDFCGVTNLF
jgi:UDP-N-acetyl-D-mannosaminuronic acid dehydrogenase